MNSLRFGFIARISCKPMEQKSNAQSLWRVTGKLQGALI